MEIAAPFQNHSATSKEAARSIAGKIGPMEREILMLFASAPGMGFTDDELIDRLGTQSARPRRIYLTRMGVLMDSSLTRKTRSGRRAVVWVTV